MNKYIKELIEISQYAGNRVDYTQGGGGNTSVKTDDGEMFIKASGYKLKDISENNAYVPIDYVTLKDFLSGIDLNIKADYAKMNNEVTAKCTLKKEGLKELRPSVEVGFHAVLKRVVCHTHSIYANLLTCAKDGEKIASKLFSNSGFNYIFMPYIDPGFMLSLKMQKAVNALENYPEVIFMQNHGLVVSGDTVERVEEINEKVNNTIKAYFVVNECFTGVTIKQDGENFVSETPYINAQLGKTTLDLQFFDKYPLYPDQLVYLNNLLRNTPQKLQCENGKLVYRTGENEARTLEETLFAYLFVLNTLKQNNLEISVMSEKDVDFINNWEAEKYRRSLSK